MRKLLPFLIVVLIALSSDVSARPTCLSHAEAKKVYRGAYLYWRKVGRERCWSFNRHDGRRYQFVPAKVMASLPPKKQETQHIEPALAWTPEWSWVFDIIRDNPLTFDGYSTFPPGEEPEVWPTLPPPPDNAKGTAIVVACGAMAMVAGIMLHKWRLTRIRIT